MTFYKRFRKITPVLLGVLLLLLSLDHSGSHAARWDFTASTEGWTGNSVSLVQGSDGVIGDFVMWATANGAADPYLVSPSGWSVTGPANVNFRMASNWSNYSGKIYYLTTVDSTWTESKSASFSVSGPGAYYTYTVPLNVAAIINRIRIDPATSAAAGTVVGLAWLEVVSQPGTITGGVRDSVTNSPLVGASVRLEQSNTIKYGPASTNSSGNYTITNVTPGAYSVVGLATGYQNGSYPVTITAGQTTAQNLALTQSNGIVTGGVRDALTSSPLVGATVRLEQGGQIKYTATTNSSGVYTINDVAPGSYNDVGLATGYQNALIPISVTAGQTASQNLALSPNGTITGGVRDSVTNSPLVGASVRLEQSNTIKYGPVSTNSSGNYTITNITPGAYSVVGLATGYQNGSYPVTITAGQTTAQNLALTQSNGIVTGGVRDALTSSPLVGATVRLEQGGQIKYTATTNSSGVYTINDVAPGSYNDVGLATGYQNALIPISVTAGQTASQNLALSPNGTITGGVRDSVTNSPLVGASVRLEQSNTIKYGPVSTNSSGNYTITNITPGAYSVVGLATGYQNGSYPVTITAGQTTSQNLALSPNVASSSWVPLYRLYNSSTKDHFYTTSVIVRNQKAEKAAGYAYERVEGFVSNSSFGDKSQPLMGFYVYKQQQEWTSPLYHSVKGTDNFYTTSKYEYQHSIGVWGFTDNGIAGYVATRLANNRPQGYIAGVGMAVGNLTLPSFTDLSLNGVGPSLSFTRYYDSYSPGTSLGQGWSFNYDSYLLEDASGGIHVEWGNGSESHFDGNLIPYLGYFEKAVKIDETINGGVNYGYDITTKDQTVYKFRRFSINDPNGLPAKGPNILLNTITDKYRNTLSLYRQGSYGVVTSATELATGRVFNYTYTPVTISDSRTVQRLTKVTDTSLNPNRTINFAYDTRGNLSAVTDVRGNTTSYSYNADGFLSSITYPEGNSVAIIYNPLLQASGYTNGTISLSFDYQGGTTGTIVKNGASPLVNFVPDPQYRASKITYAGNAADYTQPSYCPGNQLNLPCSVKDRNGNTSYFTYDANGNLLTTKNAKGETTTYVYDPVGKNNITSITDPRGNTTTFAYNASFINLLSVKKPLGGTTTYTYYSNGLQETVTDPSNHSIYYTYDSNGNATKIKDNSLSTSVTFTNDNAGRRISRTDQNLPIGQVTTYTYDNNDNVTSVQVANSPAAIFRYDRNNRLYNLLDPRGKTTSYTYNTMNLLATQQSPDSKTWQYGYDAVGNISSVKLPDNSTVSYDYYPNNRLQYVNYNGGRKVTFSYDNNGNILALLDAVGGTTTFSYNEVNRVTAVTDPFGNGLSYVYDANGNRASITYPGGKVVSYVFDADNRLWSVKDWLNGTTTYSYNSAGILQSVTNANGTTATYGYDPGNRLNALTNKKVNSTVFAEYSLVLDNVGNPTGITRNDPLGPSALAATDIPYAYNDANQIQSAGSINYTHDLLGNLNSAGNGRTFTFDYANRLTNATQGTDVFTYLYDGFGNRIARTKNGTQIRYLLDLNASMSQVLAEMGAANSVQNYYVYGQGLISRITQAGVRSTYHYDTIGNTVAVTDDSGAITESYSYDEFGATLATSPANSTNPFRYVGKYGVMDEGNGILHMRARYYDTGLGRFISRDPIGFEGGDLNLYAYVGGNPLAAIDPEGLAKNDKDQSRYYTDTDQFGYAMRRIETTLPNGDLEIKYEYCNWWEKAKAVARLTVQFGKDAYRFLWDNFTMIRVLNEFNKYGPFLDPSTWDAFRKGQLPSPLPFGIKLKPRTYPA